MELTAPFTEGQATKAIESVTGNIPSTAYLIAGLSAMAASATLKLLKKDHLALFIGQWAAPFLIMGIYNKIVKTEGHDQIDRG
jgi:hypothetical protein